MDKTISSSSFDVIVVRQPNNTFKSTPFQVAYSSNLLKNLKNHQLQLYVNNQKIDIPLKLSLQNGRVLFVKKYQKRNPFSDSSDFSDDEISQRSHSRDKIINKNMIEKKQKTDDFKNQKAPKPFWQFAWLFNRQNQQVKKDQNNIQPQKETDMKSSLSQIDEQIYQGQQNSKQPMLHLSLCKSSLKKLQKKQQVLKEFYKKRIPYQQFIKDPIKFIGDSELIVKIDDSLYTWQLGLAILTCRIAYNKQMSTQLIDTIIRNKYTKSKLFSYFTGDGLAKIDISSQNNKKQITFHQNINALPTKIIRKQRKTPDTDMIKKMNLKSGMNKAKFVLLAGNVKQQINLKIFLWDYNEKLIISDIDGTITKSDIAGQLLNNYIHMGVTKLFAQAYKRGYKFVYLTARAIGQYNQTTKFLQSAQQQGIKLPQGPLLMSPDGYFKSFTREVIDKTPDTLKTKILATLNQIFPQHHKPLYCGFGNRQTDSVAYLRTNMNPERIFFITPKSLVSIQSRQNFITSYIEMLEKINEYFPIFIKEFSESDLNFQESAIRKSKKSIDLDEQDDFPSENKITKAFSQHKQEKASLMKSQDLNKNKQFQQNQLQQEFTSIKHLRSKSVQHINEDLQHKIQEVEKILKSPISNKDQNIQMNLTQIIQQNNSQINLPKQAQYKAVDQNEVIIKNNQKINQSPSPLKQSQKSQNQGSSKLINIKS